MVKHQIKVIQALFSGLAQGGRGVTGTPHPKQPEQPLKLYEFEGSPYCRRVREVLTLLNLDYEVYPCPKGGTKYRPLVKQLGGKTQFLFYSMRTLTPSCTNLKILFTTCLNNMVAVVKHRKSMHIIPKHLMLLMSGHW